VRLAAQVFAAYALLLIVGALWRLGPFERAVPDLVALFAIYLGLAARERIAPAMLAAVVMGYLADLIMGVPGGLLSTPASSASSAIWCRAGSSCAAACSRWASPPWSVW